MKNPISHKWGSACYESVPAEPPQTSAWVPQGRISENWPADSGTRCLYDPLIFFLQCLRLGEKFQNPLACCIGPLTLQIMDLVQYGEDCEWNKHYNTSTRTQRRVSANPGAPLGRRSKTKRKRSQAKHKQSSSPTSAPAPRTPTTSRRGRTKKRK
mgnify:CR=1 FL=1